MRVGDNFSKNLHKLGYYSGNAVRSLVPRAYWQWQCDLLMSEYEAMTGERRAAIDAFQTRSRYQQPPNPPATLPSPAKAAPTASIFAI